MIDRNARIQLLAITDSYLDGTIKSFAFDEKIEAILPVTKDQTVISIINTLYCYYDDLIDHPVRLSRPQWDYIQRLRLVLHTDARLVSKRQGAPQRKLAVAGLLLFALAAWLLGWGFSFLVFNLVLGVIATAAVWNRSRQSSALSVQEQSRYPFGSFASLRATRRLAPAFVKLPYPKKMDLRPLRYGISGAVTEKLWIVLFPRFSPLPLILLAAPLVSRQSVEIPAIP